MNGGVKSELIRIKSEKREVEVIDFNAPYRVSVPAVRRCTVLREEEIS